MKRIIRMPALILLSIFFSLPVFPAVYASEHSVCIDPGHQGSWVDMSENEPLAPGSSEMKAKATTGTQGSYTGVPEYQLNLSISLLLKEELEERGYRVVMTRTDHDTAISNSERALLAAESGCDVMVRIHANSSTDPSVQGALAMIMSSGNPYVGDLFDKSYLLSLNILNRYCQETGFKNLGIQPHDDMTGINWSKIPVTILEMGYMSNSSDDIQMQNPEMQKKMAAGIANGLDDYFKSETSEAEAEKNTERKEKIKGKLPEIAETVWESLPEPESGESWMETEETDPLLLEIRDRFLAQREASGQVWAVSLERLSAGGDEEEENGSTVYREDYHGDLYMQSASVIKVFIMGAVYDRICYPSDPSREIPWDDNTQLRSLLEQMITVSDNSAANRLVEILGGGDFGAGALVVKEFCEENGYRSTDLGRMFMDSNPTGDNYTSANDCKKILTDIYRGTCVCPEASEKMLGLLKGQTVRHKIPAGLPAGYGCANKTGEMPLGYGLGCIENDIAIVFGPDGDYVLCILSNELNGDNTGAQQTIAEISSYVAGNIK